MLGVMTFFIKKMVETSTGSRSWTISVGFLFSTLWKEASLLASASSGFAVFYISIVLNTYICMAFY